MLSSARRPERNAPVPSNSDLIAGLGKAALDTSYVSLGARRTASVHEFYRYPGRFSPAFARAAIELFSEPGDLVLDPFMGGGTTLVEARLRGRLALGADINSLAVFVSRAKTRAYHVASCQEVEEWSEGLDGLRLSRSPLSRPKSGTSEGRALDRPGTWRIRSAIGLALDSIASLHHPHAQLLARCAILRTAQWALDMRDNTPAVSDFRQQLCATSVAMAAVAREYGAEVARADQLAPRIRSGPRTAIVSRPAESIAPLARVPRLILTSPPYPGVYVNYHRWKVYGRKETGAPFWITGSPDGHGIAYYTMGARADDSGNRYFDSLARAWSNLAKVADSSTRVIQLLGFGKVQSDLERYLRVMQVAGFEEEFIAPIANNPDGRLWRSVPGRRWWVVADSRTATAPSTAREVVLVHRLKASGFLGRTRPDRRQ